MPLAIKINQIVVKMTTNIHIEKGESLGRLDLIARISEKILDDDLFKVEKVGSIFFPTNKQTAKHELNITINIQKQ